MLRLLLWRSLRPPRHSKGMHPFGFKLKHKRPGMPIPGLVVFWGDSVTKGKALHAGYTQILGCEQHTQPMGLE